MTKINVPLGTGNPITILKRAESSEGEIMETCEKTEMQGFVRICDKGDYRAAYKAHLDFENGFDDPEIRDIMPFEEFLQEIKKGYGNSSHIQIARLKETEDGIYYDNEYVA
jgi:hypothetical protein